MTRPTKPLTDLQKRAAKLIGLSDLDIDVIESVRKAYGQPDGFVAIWVEPHSVAWFRDQGMRRAMRAELVKLRGGESEES
jgi:hypothetical protein